MFLDVVSVAQLSDTGCMKTQNTSAPARRQPLMGRPIHSSQQTRIAENADEFGNTRRILQTSALQMTWVSGELCIACRVTCVEMAKAAR